MLTKKRLVLGIAACGLGLLVLGGGFTLLQQSRYQLSETQAQTIALKDAGLSAADATMIRVQRDMDDFQPTYDVEIETATGAYDYVIDGETGSILEREQDVLVQSVSEVTTSSASTTTSSSSKQSQGQSAGISADEAKNKALADAGLKESAVSNLIVQTDVDHGETYYEVDFNDEAAGLDYDYTIDATTGDIVDKSRDSLRD